MQHTETQQQTARFQPEWKQVNRGKYCVIGSEAQVAATEARSNLTLARRIYAPAKFSNGRKALVVHQVATRREAEQLLSRSNGLLAFVSGRLGRWLTPTFVVVETGDKPAPQGIVADPEPENKLE